MIPRDYQVELAKLGADIIRKYMMVYLAMEERTGKTLTVNIPKRDLTINISCSELMQYLVLKCIYIVVFQGDKIPDELPDELQPEKVPKPLSALPNLNGTAPKVSKIRQNPTQERL